MKRIAFHPNNTGYEKMKQAILEKINATKKLGVKNNPIKEKVPSFKKSIFGNGYFRFGQPSLAFAIVVQGRLATPREDVSQLHQAVGTKDVKVGTMTTTRDQLNDTIKSLLKNISCPTTRSMRTISKSY